MENNESKKNPIVKGILYFLNYLRLTIFDFINSFRYNNMKASAICVAIPGLIIGFFLNAHALTISKMVFNWVTQYHVNYVDELGNLITTKSEYKYTADVFYDMMPFDYTGLVIFLLMLIGILNVFFALGMSGKKNLGSVVGATVLTSLLVILTALYLFAIIYFKSLVDEGGNLKTHVFYLQQFNEATGENVGEAYLDENFIGYNYWIANSSDYKAIEAVQNSTGGIVTEIKKVEFSTEEAMNTFNSNYLPSVVSICVCDVISIVGCVLGFIFYDRTYEKVDR